jgi:hypothetical protein
MPINRFHWGISHYIGSQLRQCVLDPDGVTLFPPKYRHKVPVFGRRLAELAHPSEEEAEELPMAQEDKLPHMPPPAAAE